MRFATLFWRALFGLAVLGCGARTAVEVTETDAGPPRDAGPSRSDIGPPLDAGMPPDAGSSCPEEVVVGVGVEVEVERPTVMWLLDRSSSMGLTLGDSGLDRTQAMRIALVEALDVLDASADTGAVLFPGLTGGLLPRCELPSEAAVEAGPMRGSQVLDALDSRPVHGGTPMAESLRVARIALIGRNLPSIVLVTDGAPNCHPDLSDTIAEGADPIACIDDGFERDLCFDDMRTLREIAAARDDGVTTYVVGMDIDVPLYTDLLDRMAVEGGRPRDGMPRYYDVRRPEQLREAFESITEEIVSCRFRAPTEPGEEGVVRVDGMVTEEWRARGTDVELFGSACARAREGATVTFIGSCL